MPFLADDVCKRASELIEDVVKWLPDMPTDNDLRAIPTVAAVLSAPDAVRAEAILQLAETGGPIFDGMSTVITRRWREHRLLSLAARKRLPLDVAQLERLTGSLEPWPRQTTAAVQALGAVVGLIEYNAGRLNPADRAEFDAAARGLLATVREVRGGNPELARLRLLIAGDRVDVEIVSASDAVGARIREIVAAADLCDPATNAFLLHLLTPGKSGGKPSQKWIDAAAPLAAQASSSRALISAILKAARDADDSDVEYLAYGNPYLVRQFVVETNEAILLNTVAVAAVLCNPNDIPVLEEFAAKCIQGLAVGDPPRSLTAANASVHAIAAIGGGSALAALRTLEGTVKHGAFLREVAKAIKSLAAAEAVQSGSVEV